MTAKKIGILVLTALGTTAVCYWAVSGGYLSERIYGVIPVVVYLAYVFVKISEENIHF